MLLTSVRRARLFCGLAQTLTLAAFQASTILQFVIEDAGGKQSEIAPRHLVKTKLATMSVLEVFCPGACQLLFLEPSNAVSFVQAGTEQMPDLDLNLSHPHPQCGLEGATLQVLPCTKL